MRKSRKLSAGDWVEVRNKEEILRSLDNNGQLDGMPLMPEMLQSCGKRFQVLPLKLSLSWMKYFQLKNQI